MSIGSTVTNFFHEFERCPICKGETQLFGFSNWPRDAALRHCSRCEKYFKRTLLATFCFEALFGIAIGIVTFCAQYLTIVDNLKLVLLILFAIPVGLIGVVGGYSAMNLVEASEGEIRRAKLYFFQIMRIDCALAIVTISLMAWFTLRFLYYFF